MSIYTIERVLWDLQDSNEKSALYRNDPDEILENYSLTPDELSILSKMNIEAMVTLGVDQMLMFMTWQAINGPQGIPEYMQRLNNINNNN
ncbi:hypothetical protein [Shewanella inventionis]|jgi:hypothetical protein|uniref:Extradiol ring-cleavage dioxygenase LigAB LigA subunit domain-containing protein n=1 Tax=Shewanella inventionis TaxID=1738770 RepID=A0ABQ1JUM8_9GAMM|nr:hypothetical protein [Shewanella inventionis]MCL1159792.1 hypothetical protein [Shewanella inventionis]GGB75084.1 hypothetical protein GCM10011607_39290 [Shewanella inventionis]